MKASLCLVVMVYNNADVLPALIASVKDHVDYFLFFDNQEASTDGTVDICKGTRDSMYCQYNKPFHSGDKRTVAMIMAATLDVDYYLVMDADNTLELSTENPFCNLDKDAYLIMKDLGGVQYPFISLLSGRQRWKYTGVIHEYPELMTGTEFTTGTINGVIIHEPVKVMGDGPGQRPLSHYFNHALLIERELLDNRDLTLHLRQRYMFYLGQSYRDAGCIPRAIDAYKGRAAMGGWAEEVFYSLLQIARLDGTLESAIKAFDYRPQRLEGALELMYRLNEKANPFSALAIGEYAKYLVNNYARYLVNPDTLFVEKAVYDTYFNNMMNKLRHIIAGRGRGHEF